MNFLYAVFFGVGATALAYSTFGRRIGYANKQNILYFIGAIFVITTIVFYTILSSLLH